MRARRMASRAAGLALMAAIAITSTGGPAGAEVPPTVVPGVGSVLEGDAGTTTVAVPVTLSSPSAQTVTVPWTTLFAPGAPAGQATPTTDYTPVSGTLTIAPGETSGTVAVTVVGDPLVEPDEYLVVSFHDPAGAVMGGYWGLGFGVITNDDHATVVPGVASVVEGNSGTATVAVPVTLSNPSTETVQVPWTTLFASGAPAGQATPTEDYTTASGTATFTPGQTSTTVSLTVIGDTLVEPDEYLVVSFHDPTNAVMGGYWGLGFGVITNDDNRAVLTVTPAVGLAGGQTVAVAGSGLTPGVAAGWCQGVDLPPGATATGSEWCGVGVNGSGTVAADGTFGAPLRLHRFIYVPALADWVDCAAAPRRCNVGAAEIADIAGTGAAVPIEFAPPPPPPATRGTISLSPSTDVRPDQVVTVTGSGFRPGQLVDLFSCLPGPGVPADPSSCGLLRASVTADAGGGFTTTLAIQQVVTDLRALVGQGGEPYDCLAAPSGPCRVVAAEAVDFGGTAAAAPFSMAPPSLLSVTTSGVTSIIGGEAVSAVAAPVSPAWRWRWLGR